MSKTLEFKIPTKSSYQVPIQVIKANNASQTIIILPALGVSAGFYIPIAEELAIQGFNAVLFEQRGHGKSSIRASRKNNYGFKEWLDEDIPAVCDWIEEKLPSSEIVLFGHSLGGHLAACYAAIHPDKITRVILSACSTPWVGAYSGTIKWQLKLLNRLIPLAHLLFGYYPGKLLGFGGNEARTLMNDWRVLVSKNTYFAKNLDNNLETKVSLFSGKVLSLSFDADKIAPYKGIKAVNDKFKSASLEHRLFKSKKLGFPADHFKWARKPKQIATLIKSWLLFNPHE
jgi:predicted alpha/beta hydrolase